MFSDSPGYLKKDSDSWGNLGGRRLENLTPGRPAPMLCYVVFTVDGSTETSTLIESCSGCAEHLHHWYVLQ